jgi:hypothetical protein
MNDSVLISNNEIDVVMVAAYVVVRVDPKAAICMKFVKQSVVKRHKNIQSGASSGFCLLIACHSSRIDANCVACIRKTKQATAGISNQIGTVNSALID